MYATVRRIRVKAGQAEEVGRLIDTEYVPLIKSSGGFVSYTLVDLGTDEVTSVGVFESAENADKANEIAKQWTSERLSPLVDSPLEAVAGHILVDARD